MNLATYWPAKTQWTADRVQKLKEICTCGSMTRVAEQLNRQTGSKFSRNSVIGKMNRMGLKGQPAPKHRPAPKPKPGAMFRPPPPTLVMEMPQHDTQQPPFLCVSIFDLELEQCRYPQGEPVVYCGQPTQDGSSYCAFHHRLCHTSFTPNAERFVNSVRIG